MVGDEACQIYRAANTVRNARNIIPTILNTMGINAKQLSHVTQGTSTTLASIIGGGGGDFSHIPNSQTQDFTPLELNLAKTSINVLKPALHYLLALVVVDTWIYFTHRVCHVNRTLYRLVHAQHHRIYVSYTYGAVYSHWLETLFSTSSPSSWPARSQASAPGRACSSAAPPPPKPSAITEAMSSRGTLWAL
ncbi:MAG: hypothetical protein Q9208_007629 [Pyrenodesmia sp. 3 TL-2023]